MLAAALILLLAAAILLIIGLFGGGGEATLDLGPFNLETSPTVVFFLGMLTLLLFVAALMLFRSAGRRANERRKERKQFSELSEKLDKYESNRDGKDEEQASRD